MERVFLDGALVVFYPNELSAVGREHHAAVGGELLLIHPVGYAVDDLIALAVGGDLALGVVVEEFHEEDIVIAHVGYHIAVGRE